MAQIIIIMPDDNGEDANHDGMLAGDTVFVHQCGSHLQEMTLHCRLD